MNKAGNMKIQILRFHVRKAMLHALRIHQVGIKACRIRNECSKNTCTTQTQWRTNTFTVSNQGMVWCRLCYAYNFVCSTRIIIHYVRFFVVDAFPWYLFTCRGWWNEIYSYSIQSACFVYFMQSLDRCDHQNAISFVLFPPTAIEHSVTWNHSVILTNPKYGENCIGSVGKKGV